jgi:hypothetical protein
MSKSGGKTNKNMKKMGRNLAKIAAQKAGGKAKGMKK